MAAMPATRLVEAWRPVARWRNQDNPATTIWRTADKGAGFRPDRHAWQRLNRVLSPLFRVLSPLCHHFFFKVVTNFLHTIRALILLFYMLSPLTPLLNTYIETCRARIHAHTRTRINARAQGWWVCVKKW